MTIQELLDILNNPDEIPILKYAEICFYLKDKEGKGQVLELARIGVFDISTDITFVFRVDKNPVLIKPATVLKPDLQEARLKGEG